MFLTSLLILHLMVNLSYIYVLFQKFTLPYVIVRKESLFGMAGDNAVPFFKETYQGGNMPR